MQSRPPLFLSLRIFVRLGLGLVLLVGLYVVMGGQARPAYAAQTLTVSDCTTDTQLQADITIANTESGDTINFSCSGDIKLTTGLQINASMTLDGSGQTVTLDGQSVVYPAILQVSAGVTFTLKALTLANSQGSGLYNNGGTTNITNSTFTGNPTNGLVNFGTTNVTNSTFTGNGSLVFNQTNGIHNGNFPAILTITNSTVANNSSANDGGGLVNDPGGRVTITNSTFTGNQSEASGGGIGNGGTMTITNSTIANNTAALCTLRTSCAAGGGGIQSSGTLTITNSTIAYNTSYGPTCGNCGVWGGGIAYYSGTLNISGSIVANNTGSTPQNPNCSGTLSDQGYNLEGGTDCGFTGTGSLQGTDPQLASALADNGGPTQTIALQQGSPAIDHIPTALCPSTDQRGFFRPDENESSCDIGAYESGATNVQDKDLGLTNVPANITTNATSPQGAVVTYTPPTVVDEDNPLPTVSCSPVSGSTFPIGTTTVTCTATDSDDTNSPVSQSFTVTVKPVLTASGKSVSATEGQSFSGVVATGTAYGAGTPSASIDWGDGQTSSGTVSLAADGSYSVTGTHTYVEEGASYPLKVTVSGSGVPNATATSSASVSDAALTANPPTAVIKGNTLTLTTTFTDADPNGTASDYTASITWGDGTAPSAATIGSSGASFSATASHKYAKHGTYTITVTIKDAGGSSVTKTLTLKA